MAAIRVLIVEDSLTIRKYLYEVLSHDSDLEVVGEAEDGASAIALCRELRPDVITMDMMLPVMSGLAATEFIMAHFPTPILIVSASTNRGELFKTYEALSAGAVDVLDKPIGEEHDTQWEKKLIASVKLVARIRVITHLRARLAGYGQALPISEKKSSLAANRNTCQVVAIGTSTGGPAAIVEILRALAPDFQIPILLVIHIGEPFGEKFADWLDGQSPRRVRYAEEGVLVSELNGCVAMAPANKHLEVRNGRLHLSDAPERHSCRPSVDVLFESLAIEYGASVTACLLTGMGRDGASGLLAIKDSGGLTVAQDEASSVVYGMPREAMLLGAVERSLPLCEIGPALNALAIANKRLFL